MELQWQKISSPLTNSATKTHKKYLAGWKSFVWAECIQVWKWSIQLLHGQDCAEQQLLASKLQHQVWLSNFLSGWILVCCSSELKSGICWNWITLNSLLTGYTREIETLRISLLEKWKSSLSFSWTQSWGGRVADKSQRWTLASRLDRRKESFRNN